MYISTERLQQVFPNTPKAQLDAVVGPLSKTMTKYGITTDRRAAMFISQLGHESAGFTKFVENLNYSAAALLATWPSRFDKTSAAAYARKPEKIANHVYANRLGNGDEASGDGWKYRGRGAIQITGKAQYASYAYAIGKSLDDTVAYMETIEGALDASGWWWNNNALNGISDQGNVTLATLRINGGTNGLDDRKELYNTAVSVFV